MVLLNVREKAILLKDGEERGHQGEKTNKWADLTQHLVELIFNFKIHIKYKQQKIYNCIKCSAEVLFFSLWRSQHILATAVNFLLIDT